MFLWLAHKAVDICNSGTDTSDAAKLRATTIWALSEFVRMLDASDIFLTDEYADRAALLGEYYLCCYVIVCDAPLSLKRDLGIRPARGGGCLRRIARIHIYSGLALTHGPTGPRQRRTRSWLTRPSELRNHFGDSVRRLIILPTCASA